jgi:hypothetical protein
MGRGDKTVPIESALRISNGYDLNAPHATVVGISPTLTDTRQVEHTKLTHRAAVQQMILSFLTAPEGVAPLSAAPASDPPMPLPLNYLTTISPAIRRQRTWLHKQQKTAIMLIAVAH